MQDSKVIKFFRQMGQYQVIMAHLEVQHISPASLRQFGDVQYELDNASGGIPVFNVEKGSPLPKTICCMLGFNTDTLPEVRLTDPLNQIIVKFGVFFQFVDGRHLHRNIHHPVTPGAAINGTGTFRKTFQEVWFSHSGAGSMPCLFKIFLTVFGAMM